MDFFCRVKIFRQSSQIVSFSNNEAPESDKIGICNLTVLRCWNGFYAAIVTVYIRLSFSIYAGQY